MWVWECFTVRDNWIISLARSSTDPHSFSTQSHHCWLVSIHENISIFCVRIIKGVNTVRNSWIISLTSSSTDPILLYTQSHHCWRVVTACIGFFLLFSNRWFVNHFNFTRDWEQGQGSWTATMSLLSFLVLSRCWKSPTKQNTRRSFSWYKKHKQAKKHKHKRGNVRWCWNPIPRVWKENRARPVSVIFPPSQLKKGLRKGGGDAVRDWGGGGAIG